MVNINQNLEKHEALILPIADKTSRSSFFQSMNDALNGQLTAIIEDQSTLTNEKEIKVLHTFGQARAKYVVTLGVGRPKNSIINL